MPFLEIILIENEKKIISFLYISSGRKETVREGRGGPKLPDCLCKTSKHL